MSDYLEHTLCNFIDRAKDSWRNKTTRKIEIHSTGNVEAVKSYGVFSQYRCLNRQLSRAHSSYTGKQNTDHLNIQTSSCKKSNHVTSTKGNYRKKADLNLSFQSNIFKKKSLYFASF